MWGANNKGPVGCAGRPPGPRTVKKWLLPEWFLGLVLDETALDSRFLRSGCAGRLLGNSEFKARAGAISVFPIASYALAVPMAPEAVASEASENITPFHAIS